MISELKTQTETIIRDLEHASMEIQKYGSQILALMNKAESLTESCKITEYQKKLTVIQIKDAESGKPLYTNEESRTAALKTLLKDDKDYQKLQDELGKIIHNREQSKLLLESEQRNYEIAKLKIRFLTALIVAKEE